jgi:hypothetical protein
VKVGVWCAVSAKRNVLHVFFNETINCERYLRVEGQCFQLLLRTVNKGKNFPSFQMLLACLVIGKIHLHFAAGSAPVAVKHRAVKASSLLKNILYLINSKEIS